MLKLGSDQSLTPQPTQYRLFRRRVKGEGCGYLSQMRKINYTHFIGERRLTEKLLRLTVGGGAPPHLNQPMRVGLYSSFIVRIQHTYIRCVLWWIQVTQTAETKNCRIGPKWERVTETKCVAGTCCLSPDNMRCTRWPPKKCRISSKSCRWD